MFYVSHYLVSSKFEAADEIMAKVQDQFQEVKMDFKTRNSSKKKVQTYEFLHTGPENGLVLNANTEG